MTTTLLDEPISTVGSVSAKTKFPSILSWDEFLALPQETLNAALIDGEVIANPPGPLHEEVVLNLAVAFKSWTRGAPGRGAVCTQQPIKIRDDRGYQPDFAWYAEEQCSPVGERLSFSGLPSLVVEIYSPSTRRHDQTRKRVDYERVGIPEIWFVDPIACDVVCWGPKDGEALLVDTEYGWNDILTSPLLDGFSLTVSELFRR